MRQIAVEPGHFLFHPRIVISAISFMTLCPRALPRFEPALRKGIRVMRLWYCLAQQARVDGALRVLLTFPRVRLVGPVSSSSVRGGVHCVIKDTSIRYHAERERALMQDHSFVCGRIDIIP